MWHVLALRSSRGGSEGIRDRTIRYGRMLSCGPSLAQADREGEAVHPQFASRKLNDLEAVRRLSPASRDRSSRSASARSGRRYRSPTTLPAFFSAEASSRLGRPMSKPWPIVLASARSAARSQMRQQADQRDVGAAGRRILGHAVERREHAGLDVDAVLLRRHVEVDADGARPSAGACERRRCCRSPPSARRATSPRRTGSCCRSRR